MDLKQKAGEFVDAVKKTTEFRELKQAQAEIDRNPSLKNKLEELQRRQMEVFKQNRPSSEIELKIQSLNQNFKRLSSIPEVKKYFAAGKKFNDMIAKHIKFINESIDSGLKSN